MGLRQLSQLASWLFLIVMVGLAAAIAADPLLNWGLLSGAEAQFRSLGTSFHIIFVVILYAAVLPAAHHAKRLWMHENTTASSDHGIPGWTESLAFIPGYLISSFGLAFLSMLSVRYAAGVTQFNSLLFFATCLLPSLVFMMVYLGEFAVLTVSIAAAAPFPLHYVLIALCFGLLLGPFFAAYYLTSAAPT